MDYEETGSSGKETPTNLQKPDTDGIMRRFSVGRVRLEHCALRH